MIPYCILVIEDDDDREFMTLLYIRYQRLLYKEIYEILKKPWNTEDILQATLVKLIDPGASPKGTAATGRLYLRSGTKHSA